MRSSVSQSYSPLYGSRFAQRQSQSHLVKLPQRLRRLDAELADELLAAGPVALQGVRLPPGTIQRQHQQPTQPFTQRMVGHQPGQLGDALGMRAEVQLRRQALLEYGEAELLQPRGLGLQPAYTAQGGAVPQPQRVPQPGGALVRGGLPARARHPVLERVQVDLGTFGV